LILKKEGFISFRKYIIDNKIDSIDIIGGSHSGFSVAWMLLNGSAMFNYEASHLSQLPEVQKFTSDKFYIGENFAYDDWRIPPIFDEIDFPLKINILFRDKIRVYYKTIKKAEDDNYFNYDTDGVSNKGAVYAFTGLRGDAKKLWKQIVLQQEN